MCLEEFESGQAIIRQNEEGDKFYLIDQGSVLVETNGKVVVQLEDGSYFGERALIHDDVRNANVIAASYTTCFTVARDSFVKYFGSLHFAWIYEALRKVPLLSALSEDQMLKLAKVLKEEHYQKDSTLFSAGDDGETFYIVQKGTVVILSQSGEELAICQEGQCFGERALLSSESRAATVRTLEETFLLSCDRNSFNQHLGNLEELRDMWRIETLRRVPLLQQLNLRDLRMLCKELTVHSYKPGENVVLEGEIGQRFYIIEHGEFKVIKNYSTHGCSVEQPQEVARITVGQCFGERALLRDEPRAATVQAITESKALVLSRENFETKLKSIHKSLSKTAAKIDSTIATRIQQSILKSDLQIIKPLGNGAFGKVYLVRYQPNKRKYALKSIKKETIIQAKLAEHVIREKSLMESFSSPFVVSLAASFQDSTNLYMMIKYVVGGEFFNYLNSCGGEIPEKDAQFYAACVVLGLEHMLEKEIAWR